MKDKTTKLVTALAVLAVFLGGAGVYLALQKGKVPTSIVPEIFQVAGGVDLSLVPSQANMAINDEQQFEVRINTHNHQVSAAEVHLEFDGGVLEGVSFAEGNFLSVVLQPGQVSGGAASIILGSTPAAPKQGEGVLATLTVRALQETVSPMEVNFGAGTQVAAIGSEENVIGSTTGATVTVGAQGVTETPTITVSPTPTVTVAPDTVNMQFKVKFAGVSSKVADQLVKVRVFKVGGVDTWFADVPVVADNQGVFTGQVELVGIAPGSGYTIYIKGPKHLARRFCEDGQTVRCGVFEGNLGLALGLNEFDFSGLNLEPGDVPDPVNNNGQQDGIVNSTDYSLVKSRVYSQTNEDLQVADLNFDGIVNSVDVLLLRRTLETRYEDGY